MGSYSLTPDVYLTVLMHAAKYPSCSVNGVLLGQQTQQGGCQITLAVPLFHQSMVMAACVETAMSQTEAVAHLQGLQLLGYYHSDYHFNSTDMPLLGRRIAERMRDRQPATFAVVLDNQRLADFTSSSISSTAGSRSGAGGGGGASSSSSSSSGPFDLYLWDNAAQKGSWRKVQGPSPGASGSGGKSRLEIAAGSSSSSSTGAGTGGWEELRKRFLNLHAARKHQALVDFDEHLDDVSKDYLNAGLLGADTALLSR